MIIKKLVAAAGATVMLLSTSGIAFGATIDVNNTGADSRNTVRIREARMNYVYQSNSNSIDNNIVIKQNTGYNSASKNTGNGEVKTGDAIADVIITNSVAGNEAPDPCDCDAGLHDDDVTVEKTGQDSKNEVDIRRETRNSYKEMNRNRIRNMAKFMQNTGENSADKNTMNGDVDTGHTHVVIDVLNGANN